jgi:hypothetical protein
MSRYLALFFCAVAVALLAVTWGSLLDVGGSGAPAAVAAASCAPRCPGYSVAKGRARIRFFFSPQRIRRCVRHRELPWRTITCEGFGSWWAPGRWALFGVGRDRMGNEQPQAQLL